MKNQIESFINSVVIGIRLKHSFKQFKELSL